MATSNQRDIELRIAATTSGSEQVKKLTEQLEALAKEGGAAAPEFERLANEVRKIGEQGDAVQALDRLEQTIQQTSQALGEANARVNALGTSFSDQRAKVEALGDAFVQAQTQVRATEAEIRQIEAAQRSLRAETDRSEKATVGYKDRARELATQLATLRNTLAEQKSAARDASDAYETQNKALKTLASANTAAARSVTKLSNTLTEQQSAATAATKALTDLGVETTDAASAIDRVESALAGTQNEFRELNAAQAEGRRFVEQLANAQQLLNAELQLERDILQGAIATQERAAAAERQLAESKRQAAAAAQAHEQALREEAAAAAAALNDTFATTGTRSAQVIQAEIDGIVKALVRLRNDARVSGADFDRAFAGAQVRVQALERELRGIPNAMDRASGSAALLRQSLSQVTAAFGLFEIGRGFITANTQLETMRRSLSLILGSTDAAARQIQFLKDTADRAGLSYGALAQDFINFSAAAQTSGVAIEQQREVFTAVANAAGQLGLSTDRVGLILQALAQTASKGKVSLEELQGQLGESLPGALSIVANGLGVTKAQLLELVKAGIDVDKFFEAFVKGSKQAFGDGTGQVDSFAAAWNRLKNTLSDTATFFGNQGGVLTALTTVIEQTAAAVRGLGGAFELTGKIIGITAGAIANFDLTRPIESMRQWRDSITEAADEIQARLDKANGKINESANQAVAAQNSVSAATQEAAVSFQASTAAEIAAASAADQNTSAHTALAGATTAAGQAAVVAANGWAQLQLAYQGALKDAEAQITAAEKLAQAKKLEGDARIALIQISGNEANAVQARADAARQEADALDYVSQKRQAELDLIIRHRDELAQELALRGDPSGARKKEIEEIERVITARTAEVEKATAAAQASQIDATAKQVAAQTYRDNSQALDTLRAAYERAREALAAMQSAQERGLATAEQVREAQTRLATAEALYKDAVKDSAEALDRKVRAIQGSLSVTEAQINLDREKINTEIAWARETGNSYLVLERSIALKQLDIKLAEAKVAALRAEAQAMREEALAARQALDANDPLLKQKQAEIDLRLKNAQIKELEAAKTQEQIKQINAEIDAMRIRGVESTNTANKYVSDRGREAKAMEEVAAATEKAAAAERKRRNVDEKGFSKDSTGTQTVNAEMPTWLSIFNQAKSRGLSEDQARRVANEFADGNGNIPYFDNPGQKKYDPQGGGTLQYAVDRAVERYIRNSGSGGVSNSGLAGQQGASTPGAINAGNYSVTIKLGGSSKTVNTASQADAQTLVDTMKQLGDAANRSS
jgi:tape measure domain-containing protein